MERLRSSTHGHGGIFNLHPSVEPTLSEQIYSIDMILIECARGSDVEAVKPRAPTSREKFLVLWAKVRPRLNRRFGHGYAA
jgi:hypothetical protein